VLNQEEGFLTLNFVFMKKLLAIFIPLLFLVIGIKAQCFTKISNNYQHSIAIAKDSTLWHWGGMRGIQRTIELPTLLDSNSKWIDISTGNEFQMAIKSDGTLWAWGQNGFGQLGLGNNTSTISLTQVGSDADWIAVSCGEYFTLALKNNGTAWIWGRNNYGQLGNGTTNRSNRNTPEKLGEDNDWIEISAGKNHSLLRKQNNSAWFVGACYGNQASVVNQIGSTQDFLQLAASNFTDYAIKQNGTLWRWNNSNGTNTVPQQVGTDNDWSKVNCSHTANTLLIKNDSTLWATGVNTFGQLGNGTTLNINEPELVNDTQKWIDIFAGSFTTFAFNQYHQLFSAGLNTSGEFGKGINRNKPHQVIASEPWLKISGGSASYNGHTLAINQLGQLFAWGQNNDGQLGLGAAPLSGVIPTQIESEVSWDKISNGFQFSVAIKSDSTLWSWGRNGQGQLGQGQGIFSRNIPFQVGSGNNWSEVSAGGEFVIAIKHDSTLWSWGSNSQGTLGIGAGGNQFTPIQVGSDNDWVKISSGTQHTLALKADSTLWSWGNNQHGRLGRFGSTNTPQQVGEDKWIDIAAGGFHSLGIKADSSIWAWGYNLYSQLGDNSSTSRTTPVLINNEHNWIQLAAGYEHSLALKSDSTLWGWGRNGAGQLSDSTSYVGSMNRAMQPTLVQPETKFVKIEAGPVNSLGITQSGDLLTWGDAFNSELNTNRPQLGVVFATFENYINDCPACFNEIYEQSAEICLNESFIFNDEPLTEPGVYEATFMSSLGCDSTVVLSLGLNQFEPQVQLINQTLVSNIDNAVAYKWYNCITGEPIEGATNQEFSPIEDGEYQVEVTLNECSYFSECFVYSTVGISELNETRFNLYPNPAFDILNVSFKGEQEVRIFNTSGQQIYFEIARSQSQINVDKLPKGIYFIQVGLSTKKWVKN
jgi:alpha-tubulin suppressor-like RCC1 family protein